MNKNTRENQKQNKKEEQKTNSKEEQNILHLNVLYPKIEDVFKVEIKSLDQIKDNCLVVLDTNVLLLPYTVGSKELNEIMKNYSKLISENRLFIPGQVVREFLKNRPTKLMELYQQISTKKSEIKKLDMPKYPLLESVTSYKELLNKQEEINKLIKDFQKESNSILKYIGSLTWNDNVSNLYRELFGSEVIKDLELDEDKFLEELDYRYYNNMPPGFRDKSKADKGVGDLIIWKTILNLGEVFEKDMIFVTGDEKNDWYHRSMDTPLYARYELIYEYMTASKGKTIQLTNLSGLLDLFGADSSIVKEIQTVEEDHVKELQHKAEVTTRIRSMPIYKRIISDAEGICQVCGMEYPHLEIHHIVPLSLGGDNSQKNLLVLCPNCNKKLDKDRNENVSSN